MGHRVTDSWPTLINTITMFDPWKQAKLMQSHVAASNTQLPVREITSIDELKRLAGIGDSKSLGQTFGLSAGERSEIMRRQGIKPGDEAWFKLWFAKPYLTGEHPVEHKSSKKDK